MIKYEICYLVIFLGFFASCKKEGPTGETGNLDFTKRQDLNGYPCIMKFIVNNNFTGTCRIDSRYQ
jgi:hypothetical protein